MEYLRDKWDEQCVKQLRKDIVKSNKNYSFYSPCEKCSDGPISCGVHCDGEGENYFACFDPDYLAILDAITGHKDKKEN